MVDLTKSEHKIPCSVCRNNNVDVRDFKLIESAASIIVAREIFCDKCESAGRVTETWLSDGNSESGALRFDNVCRTPVRCSDCGNHSANKKDSKATAVGNELIIDSRLGCSCGNIGHLEEHWITE